LFREVTSVLQFLEESREVEKKEKEGTKAGKVEENEAEGDNLIIFEKRAAFL
jgi:hypothetical protein